MELDVLYKKATPSSGLNNLDAQLCVVPDVSFSCSGKITGLLLGATRRAIMDNGTRALYPEIQIWRQNSAILNFTRLASQEIRLTEGDFSPDGMLQYNLTTPYRSRVEMCWECTSPRRVTMLSQCIIMIVMM